MEQEEEKNTAPKKAKIHPFWDFRISKSDLKYQIENYSTLTMTQSYKGITVLIFLFFLILSLILSFFSVVNDLITMLIGIIIYLPILFFVYKGHRWAIILLMILYTIDNLFLIYDLKGPSCMAFVWWIIITVYLWKALRVENARRKSSIPKLPES